VRGSIVGTRADLREALEFAARGEIEVAYETRRLEEVNEIFEELKAGAVNGRIVLDFRSAAPLPQERHVEAAAISA
jgi:propanol-preferring alcohol dehydrogenase